MKITILGFGGSGKSTFSKELANHYNIKQTHLDQLYFNANWQPVESILFEERIQATLENNEWIVEGNYSRFGVNRLSDSDLIYIFNFNRFRCLFNIIKRRIKFNKKVRDSAAAGCYEQLDFEFFKFIVFKSRSKARKQYYRDIISRYNNKVIVFKNHRQVNKYISSLTIK